MTQVWQMSLGPVYKKLSLLLKGKDTLHFYTPSWCFHKVQRNQEESFRWNVTNCTAEFRRAARKQISHRVGWDRNAGLLSRGTRVRSQTCVFSACAAAAPCPAGTGRKPARQRARSRVHEDRLLNRNRSMFPVYLSQRLWSEIFTHT